jgi:ABC-type uncharacterized transport system auxiliary subunit
VKRREPLTRRNGFAPIAHVKFVILLAVAVAFSACTTLANRRDIYRPTKPNGPATQKIHKTSGIVGPTI